GVQTCALPIFRSGSAPTCTPRQPAVLRATELVVRPRGIALNIAIPLYEFGLLALHGRDHRDLLLEPPLERRVEDQAVADVLGPRAVQEVFGEPTVAVGDRHGGLERDRPVEVGDGAPEVVGGGEDDATEV